MTKYTRAKEDFLTWLSEQAEQKGVEVNINHKPKKEYYREPDVLARLRATTKRTRFQTRNTADELSVSDELNDRFDEVLCVILQLSDDSEFDPQEDSYYPLRVSTIERETGNRHASGEYQLSLDLTGDTTDHFENDLSLALGSRDSSNIQTEPSGSSRYQKIAQKVCREFQNKDD